MKFDAMLTRLKDTCLKSCRYKPELKVKQQRVGLYDTMTDRINQELQLE
jgi:hypothetical protein